jgi:hypothetical protein
MAAVFAIDGTLPRFSFEISLEGTQYSLLFDWNTRAARWFITLSAADGTVLLTSVAGVVDFPLFSRFADPRLPPGRLMLLDTSGAGQEMTAQEELGTRVQLVYLTASEVAEAAA